LINVSFYCAGTCIAILARVFIFAEVWRLEL